MHVYIYIYIYRHTYIRISSIPKIKTTFFLQQHSAHAELPTLQRPRCIGQIFENDTPRMRTCRNSKFMQRVPPAQKYDAFPDPQDGTEKGDKLTTRFPGTNLVSPGGVLGFDGGLDRWCCAECCSAPWGPVELLFGSWMSDGEAATDGDCLVCRALGFCSCCC
jgi:hypothetical protein